MLPYLGHTAVLEFDIDLQKRSALSKCPEALGKSRTLLAGSIGCEHCAWIPLVAMLSVSNISKHKKAVMFLTSMIATV